MSNKKYRKVKPYSELKPKAELTEDDRMQGVWETKEHRENDRAYMNELLNGCHHDQSTYCFETEFVCPECNQLKKGQIAINRNSPYQTSTTYGFVTHHWLMCNKCYYGVEKDPDRQEREERKRLELEAQRRRWKEIWKQKP